MARHADLSYDPATIVAPLDENEVRAFERWLRRSGYDSIHFEESYLEHIRRNHGGIPGKRYFRTPGGTTHAVTRFLIFLPSGSKNSLEQYSVECTWSSLNERLGKHLMPFAELFGGDMACFDFSEVGPPRIVVWYHELSNPAAPHTEFVSSSFAEFINMLTSR